MTAKAFGRLSVLTDGLRRGMYDFIRQRRLPVSREEAAAAAGVSRKLAAFHLDKLADAGLLEAHYARPPGRGGPGAGRPAKLYQANHNVEVQVSVPPRHYDIAGEILLEALETMRPEEDPKAAAERVAYERGAEVGHNAPRDQSTRAAALTEEVLRRRGFEPYTYSDGVLRLNNCPFHRLAQRSPEIVCAINRAFIEGLLRGVGDARGRALLEPRPNECCVAIRQTPEAA